jgi:hypothetical protein
MPRGRWPWSGRQWISVGFYLAALTPGNRYAVTDWGLVRTGAAPVVFVLVGILALLQLALGFEAEDDDVIRFDLLDLPVRTQILDLPHVE